MPVGWQPWHCNVNFQKLFAAQLLLQKEFDTGSRRIMK